MFEVVLVHPEIPPNTGNVIRLCANTGARLHLVQPLGFELTEQRLRRAGMDYAELAAVHLHADWTSCCARLAQLAPQGQRFALTTKGTRHPANADFRAGDVLVFGCETRGLPAAILTECSLRTDMGKVESGTSTIQTPDVDVRSFLQRVILNSGEVLVISGFEQSNLSADTKGAGHPENVLLGGGMSSSNGKDVIVVLVQPVLLNGNK